MVEIIFDYAAAVVLARRETALPCVSVLRDGREEIPAGLCVSKFQKILAFYKSTDSANMAYLTDLR